MNESSNQHGVPRIEEIIGFWLGDLDPHGLSAPETAARWFRSDPEFDAEIADRFADDHALAARGALSGWLEHPRGLLAFVLLLDQFSRNMFRDTPRMFATDARARDASLDAIESRLDHRLALQERVFVYMPLMHSERRTDQHLGCRLFEQLCEQAPEATRERLANNVDYMRRHFEIVDRFGRFPHRNRLLGRISTVEELEFLQQDGSSF